MKCVLCGGRYRKAKGGQKHVACSDCASMHATDALISLAVDGGAKPADLLSIRRTAKTEERFQSALCILLRSPVLPPGRK